MSQAPRVLPANDSQEDLWSGLEIHDDSVFATDLRHKNVRPMPIRSQMSRRPSFPLKSTSPFAHATDIVLHSPGVSEITPSHSLSTSSGSTSSVEFSKQPLKHSTLHVGKTARTPSSPKGQTSFLESKGTFGEQLSSRMGSASKKKTDKVEGRPAWKSGMTYKQSKSAQHPSNVPKPSKSTVKAVISKDANVHRIKSAESLARRARPSSAAVRKHASVPALSPQVSRMSNRMVPTGGATKKFSPGSTVTDPMGNIMRKPKNAQFFGDGTELDNIDGLSMASDEEHIFSGESTSTKSGTSVQSILWPRTGDTVHNSRQERRTIDGLTLVDFDKGPPPFVGPTLIPPSSPSKTLQLIGNMMFDPEKMQWVDLSGTADEDDIFDHAGCDTDSDSEWSSLGSQFGAGNTTNTDHNAIDGTSNDFAVGKEFDVTSSFVQTMLAAERQHGNEMSRWYPGPVQPLKNEQRFGLRDADLKRGYLYDIKKVPKPPTAVHPHS